MLRKLANYDDCKENVAGNLNTPSDVLAGLAKDEDSLVRSIVAQNVNTPASTLETMANDCPASVAGNKSAPANTLEALSHSGDHLVRLALAKNVSTPLDLLIKMTKDNNIYMFRKLLRGILVSPQNY